MSIFFFFCLLLCPFFTKSSTLTPLGSTFTEADLIPYNWQYTADIPINYLPATPIHVTSCSSTSSLFGGPNIFGPYYYMNIQTTFQLPPHYSLSFSLKFVRFGTWGLSFLTWVQFFFDSWNTTLNFANNYNQNGIFSSQTSTCGSSITIETIITQSFASHTSTSFAFQMLSEYTLASTTLSWAVTEFSIVYQTCDPACSSCTGPLNTQCPTCYSTKVYVSGLNSCSFCDSSCVNCVGPLATDCIACPVSTPYISNAVNGHGTCVSVCPSQQAANSSNFCINCSANCVTCQNGNPSLCVVCSLGYSLNSGTCFQCGSSCLTCNFANPSICTGCYDGNYLLNGACYQCDPSCTTCYGNSSSNCLSCNSSMFLYEYQCVNQCPPGSVLNSTSRQCLLCASTCQTCTLSNPYQCLSCYDGFYYNNTTFSCFLCNSQCATCQGSPDFCVSCKNTSLYLMNGTCLATCPTNIVYQGLCLNQCPFMTFYYQGSCKNTGVIGVNVLQIKQNSIFQINFSKQWSYLFDRINSFVVIDTNCSDTLGFSSQIINSSIINSFTILIDFSMNTNITRKCQISINFTINYNNSDGQFVLNTTFFVFQLLFPCPLTQYLSNSQCYPKETLLFSLNYADFPDKIKLKLEIDYGIPLNLLNDSLIISIENYHQIIDYKYNLKYISPTEYIINFLYESPIFNRPLLTVSFFFTLESLLNLTNILPTSNNQSIKLFDCYSYYSNYVDSMQKNSDAYNMMDIATSGSILAMSFLNVNSRLGSSMRGLMMVEIVFLLKYINLNYPENLRLYFNARLKLLLSQQTFIKPGYFYQDPFEINKLPTFYIFYGASPYFLEIMADTLIRQAIFIYLGLFSWILYNYSSFGRKKPKRPPKLIQKFCRWLLQTIHESLVWEYVIVFFLINHQQIFFYCFLTFYYPPLESSAGQLNFSWAFIYCFLYFVIILFFAQILKKNSRNASKTKNKISPEEIISDREECFDDNNNKFKENGKISNMSPGSLSPKEIFAGKKTEELKNFENTQVGENSNEVKAKNILQNVFTSKKSAENSPYNLINNEDALKPENFKSATIKVKFEMPKNENSQNLIKYTNSGLFSKKKILTGDNSIAEINNLIPTVKTNKVAPVKFEQMETAKKELGSKSMEKSVKPYFEILYKDLKTKTFFQSHFLIWDIIRQCLIVFIVLFFVPYAFSQILVINVLQFSFIIFTLKINPFNNFVSLGCFLGTEFFITTIFVCCLIIGIYDFKEIRNYDERITIGMAIVMCNLIFRIWTIVVMVANMILDLIRSRSEKT